jgi:hypothetical protein
MNTALFKALIASVPACLLLFGSATLFFRRKRSILLMQVVGAGCIVVAVVTHVCEAIGLFPYMHWGQEHSAGHYVDLVAAVLGFTLFPVGYVLHALSRGSQPIG